MQRIRVMVTGAGGSAAVGFCRSLRRADPAYELVGLDCDKYHLELAEVDHRYLVPPVADPDYLPVLNWIAREHAADFLHCQPDVEVEFASRQRAQLAVSTNFPSEEAVQICLDKYRSYQCWKSTGIRVPETRLIADHEDLRDAFRELGPRLWLRNTRGAAGKGALPTADYSEAVAWLDFCRGWGQFTAAQCLTDESVTWQSIWDQGELLVAQTRLRKYWEFGNRSPSGVTGLTGTGITLSDARIDALAQRCIRAVDAQPNGIFSVDFTYDADGVPNPTEINIGRFFTTHQFFSEAGVNFPDIYVKRALGLEVALPHTSLNPLEDGLAWVRGLDSRPVLTTQASIDASERQRDELRRRAREGNHESSLRHTG
jgi:carbamoyl-phosphate synthase large subunit